MSNPRTRRRIADLTQVNEHGARHQSSLRGSGAGRSMNIKAAALVALLVLVACTEPRAAVVTPVSAVPFLSPHAQTIDLNAGDPARGRRAFIALRCNACHRVAGDETLPKVEGGWDGPALQNLGAEPPEAVGWKIVTRTRLGPESIFESEMVDSASAMTEQQLVDLVAYLRHPARGRPR